MKDLYFIPLRLSTKNGVGKGDPLYPVVGITGEKTKPAHLRFDGVDKLRIPGDLRPALVRRLVDNSGAVLVIRFARAEPEKPAEIFQTACRIGDQRFMPQVINGSAKLTFNLFHGLAHGKISFHGAFKGYLVPLLHSTDVVVWVSDTVNEIEFDISERALQRQQLGRISTQPSHPGAVSDDFELGEPALPLTGNGVRVWSPFSSYSSYAAGVLQQNMEYLAVAESMLEIFKTADLACNNSVRVGVKQKADQSVRAAGVTNKHDVALNVVKQIGLTPSLKQRRHVSIRNRYNIHRHKRIACSREK